MPVNLYPMLFFPVYKDYLWGGDTIKTHFNRDIPSGIYAESWEISDREDGMSIVENGCYTGRSFKKIIQADPARVLGTKCTSPTFPLLIKILDAKDKLSVQVHPNDQTALASGGEAKSEMWYLLGEQPTSVYCGLKEPANRETFSKAIKDKKVASQLNELPVKKGDVVFVPGGTVHAINQHTLILEVQQNSNTTYRIDDWNRTNSLGEARELHVEKALEVIEWNRQIDHLPTPSKPTTHKGYRLSTLITQPYFSMHRIELDTWASFTLSGETFHTLFVQEGAVQIEWSDQMLEIPTGRSVFIPAGLDEYHLHGRGIILQTLLPDA